jgi:hypothetical protein
MAKLLFVRIAGAVGITSLALLFLGLIPFLSVDPTAGASPSSSSTFSVNREYKGDRLPSADINAAALLRTQFQLRQQPQAPREIPVGCDASFSPISSPRLAYVYGRCTT